MVWTVPHRDTGLGAGLQRDAPTGRAVLGIGVRDSRSAAQDFVTDFHVRYPSIFDPSMRSLLALGSHYPTSVVPRTIVLDRGHRVAAVYLKALLPDDIRPEVQPLTTER
ncbi:Uncharacterised protein [Nocardia africana]|uniref:Alkyl hydroperoxide reductase subunit C/ Thiol specific antioxidant domain-containing protein n=1 Tax=Nocardia africana TaxID=134964 RepID=A0A378X487_9NOCA|nr:Uncharacterised protein [Nocardia africana]